MCATFAVACGAAAQESVALPLDHPLTIDDAIPDTQGVKRLAVLRALDKITGRTADLDAPVGVPVSFGTLTVVAHTCHTRPPEETPETTAFLEIDDQQVGEERKRTFAGWMFASSPALHALEHPVYDVWVITCKTRAPNRPASPPDEPPTPEPNPESNP